MLNLLSKTATTSPLVKENVEDDLLDGRCCCREDCRKASCRDSRRRRLGLGAGLAVLEGLQLRLDSRSDVVIGVSDLRGLEGGAAVGVSSLSLFLLLFFFFLFELFRAAASV